MSGERYRLTETTHDDDGWTFDVVVTAGSPFFDGHFPGRPVLPAIAQLAILTEVYGERLVPGQRLAGVPRLKLQATVSPEKPLRYRVGAADAQARSRFSVEQDGHVVTRGSVAWREA